MEQMEYFACRHDYLRKIAKLSDQEVGRLFRALLIYSETGERLELTGREAIAFDFIADDIDMAKEAYAAKCAQSAANGSKGARARWGNGENSDRHRPLPVATDRYRSLPVAFDGDKDNNNININNITSTERKDIDTDTDTDIDKPISNILPISDSKTKSKSNSQTQYDDLFEKFWKVYPRKVKKLNARKAFDKLKPTSDLVDVMISAIEKQKQTSQWQSHNGDYIPHPATWLNGHQWEDELEVELPGTSYGHSEQEWKDFYDLAVQRGTDLGGNNGVQT